jgi:hypothetical protein
VAQVPGRVRSMLLSQPGQLLKANSSHRFAADSDAREVFRPGKNWDGYFENSDILAQAKRAMDILDRDYPNESHVLLYDNASTHRKRADNALSARNMPLTRADPSNTHRKNFLCTTHDSSGHEIQVQMTGARFDAQTPQELYYPPDHHWAGQFKGMRVIIQERRKHGANLPDPSKLKAQCNKAFRCEPGATTCCCRRILYTQPDFVHSKSMLEELCESRGYQVLFFPKFHCELNFIEQCWGYAKRLYREYPLTADEQEIENYALKAVDDVPLHSMRRCAAYLLSNLTHRILSFALIQICCTLIAIHGCLPKGIEWCRGRMGCEKVPGSSSNT